MENNRAVVAVSVQGMGVISTSLLPQKCKCPRYFGEEDSRSEVFEYHRRMQFTDGDDG